MIKKGQSIPSEPCSRRASSRPARRGWRSCGAASLLRPLLQTWRGSMVSWLSELGTSGGRSQATLANAVPVFALDSLPHRGIYFHRIAPASLFLMAEENLAPEVGGFLFDDRHHRPSIHAQAN